MFGLAGVQHHDIRMQTMAQAGTVAEQMGNQSARRYWTESAANAGNLLGMYNLGVILAEQGDTAGAARPFQQAAHAGKPDGYAASVELSEQADDQASAQRWAVLGTAAGGELAAGPRCTA